MWHGKSLCKTAKSSKLGKKELPPPATPVLLFFCLLQYILKPHEVCLLKLCVLNSHSSMHIFKTQFQRKTISNILLFSTEMHNPLLEHLLAQSPIHTWESWEAKYSGSKVITSFLTYKMYWPPWTKHKRWRNICKVSVNWFVRTELCLRVYGEWY